jgi:hypothetical protein
LLFRARFEKIIFLPPLKLNCIKSHTLLYINFTITALQSTYFEYLIFAVPFAIKFKSSVSTFFNPFLFIIPGFPYNLLPRSCGGTGLKKNPCSSVGLGIRPHSAFTAFRAILPSANYSAVIWSGVTAFCR